MSRPDPDLAALRRAFAAIPAVAPDPEACPPAERFLAAVRGELPPAELRGLVEHVAGCPACAEDWRLAQALEHPEDDAVAIEPSELPWRRRYRQATAWWASAAAAVALLVGGLLWRAPEPLGALRGGDKPIELLTHEDVLTRDAVVLRWEWITGATYDLDIRVHRGPSVERVTRLPEPQYHVPLAHLTAIPSGTELTWRVTANLPNGKRRTSAISSFILH
ncbi:MAG TPA: zf-HC2 domain-containing protein [Thermoanaerobaculia bacterium]